MKKVDKESSTWFLSQMNTWSSAGKKGLHLQLSDYKTAELQLPVQTHFSVKEAGGGGGYVINECPLCEAFYFTHRTHHPAYYHRPTRPSGLTKNC